jgi:hypothetical protein
VRDEEIHEILNEAARAPHEVDAALLKSVADSIQPSLRPVSPLASTWALTGAVFLICVAVALIGAMRAGFNGVEKMTLAERFLVFSTLGVLLWVTATAFVNQMIPASRRRVSPVALLGTTTVALLLVFGSLFRDYRTDHFLSAGVVCLLTGLLHAFPAALLSWFVLRRGFAVNSVSAGLVAGTFAGLAGVGVLELHCANFQAAHVLLWHTAVVPLSGALGAFVGWALHLRESTQNVL